MKLFKLFLIALLLTGCASSGGNSSGASQMDPTRAQAIAKAHTELAAAYYGRQQYAIALQELDKAMSADSSNPQTYNMRALVRMELHEDDKAESDFRRSLQLDEGNSETYNNYGWFLCQRGRAKESIKQFQEAVKNPLYATPEIAYSNMGLCSIKAGQMKEAGIYLQRALVLHPGMPEALYGLARWSFESGDFAGAKANFMRFTQASREAHEFTAEELWLAVRIERKMNDRNSAASYALQLSKRFPDSRETQLMLSGQR